MNPTLVAKTVNKMAKISSVLKEAGGNVSVEMLTEMSVTDFVVMCLTNGISLDVYRGGNKPEQTQIEIPSGPIKREEAKPRQRIKRTMVPAPEGDAGMMTVENDL